MTSPIAPTRQAWHAVAELVLAGPQLRRSGTIRLRVVPGGFATVADPGLQVVGASLVAGDVSVPIDGRSCHDLAEAAGVEAGAPDIYHDGTGVDPAEPLRAGPGRGRRTGRRVRPRGRGAADVRANTSSRCSGPSTST